MEESNPKRWNGKAGRSHVVVIGAGVIGLSTALCLRQYGYDVTILAQDFPAPFKVIDSSQINYTSPWAGAHNRWIPPTNAQEERDHAFALATFSRMEELDRTHSGGEAGLTFMTGLEYLESPPQQYLDLTEKRAEELGMTEFSLLERHELPPDVAWGCSYRTWCVHPMMYCGFLLRHFTHQGGKIRRRELRDPSEVFATEDFQGVRLVVNCSGGGFGDKNVFPTRGQLCIVANQCDVTITRQNRDGSWVVAIPRNYGGGTVIGGTRDVGDWNAMPDAAVREHMLANAAATYPGLLVQGEEFQVIRDVVGRRPTREGGIRLEAESVGQDRTVVHAYGLGGRGYECSWGVAQAALRLVVEADADAEA